MKNNGFQKSGAEVPNSKDLEFTKGLLAFEDYRKFTIVDSEQKDFPFKLLQSLEEDSLGFIITDPFVFDPDYDFEIGEDILQELQIEEPEEIMVYVLLVITENAEEITANMVAPVIINSTKMLARQVILEDGDYSARYRIFGNEPAESKAVESC